MKKQVIIFLLSITAFTLFYSCKKESTSNHQTYIYKLSAKLNGVDFKATQTYSMVNVDSDMLFRSVGILGFYQTKTLAITFIDSILIQSINTNSPVNWTPTNLTFEDSLSADQYGQINSTLSFSKFDTIAKLTSGTFSGTLVGSFGDTLKITDGIFTNVQYDWEHSH